ncbi:pentapeptide repeat-containing protein [Egbenema bharatensis]|uniref:pentapeptide repeat-containing protein n=1 Tax=Egbenema bharatensis TaxID=3463334 RepID=UPI003A84D0C8
MMSDSDQPQSLAEENSAEVQSSRSDRSRSAAQESLISTHSPDVVETRSLSGTQPSFVQPQQELPNSRGFMPKSPVNFDPPQSKSPPYGLLILTAIGVMLVGLSLNLGWLGLAGAVVALLISLRVIWRDVQTVVVELLSPQQRTLTMSLIGFVAALFGLLQISGVWRRWGGWLDRLNWEAIGATGEVIGAIGQILIAILAVYVAWRQYVISKDLTIQQNIITQQQTIDAFFQGISELVLDEEGLLEDLPLERAIAEGRTAAILSSVDANGKAKVLRFLSRSRLLTPLKRDGRLGRAILDGLGGYAEDRNYGTRVVDLGIMLAGADLSGTDLRWTDLSGINLIRANLMNCDLVKANLARTVLLEANLAGADLMGTRLFYGSAQTATPRTPHDIPNYTTGEFTGAVVENADFTNVQRLSPEQREYCCRWGGRNTRSTIPGGCEGIPDRLNPQ